MNEFESALTRYLSSDNLKKIRSVKVGIAGAGGLGSNCASALVRSGFRDFIIDDFDKVEPSNLNRQFFFLNQIGKFKVDALEENLRLINPDIEVEKHRERINETNIDSIFGKCGILVEAVDMAETKPVIIECAFRFNMFCVSASGIAGYGESDRIVTKKLGSGLCVVGDLKSGTEEGIPPLAPAVNIAAAKEADLILEWLLGRHIVNQLEN